MYEDDLPFRNGARNHSDDPGHEEEARFTELGAAIHARLQAGESPGRIAVHLEQIQPGLGRAFLGQVKAATGADQPAPNGPRFLQGFLNGASRTPAMSAPTPGIHEESVPETSARRRGLLDVFDEPLPASRGLLGYAAHARSDQGRSGKPGLVPAAADFVASGLDRTPDVALPLVMQTSFPGGAVAFGLSRSSPAAGAQNGPTRQMSRFATTARPAAAAEPRKRRYHYPVEDLSVRDDRKSYR